MARGISASGTRSGLDDDRQRAWPEALHQTVEGGVEVAGQFVGLLGLAEQQRERLVLGAVLQLVDAVDRVQIDRVDGKAIEGVGRQRYHVATFERLDDVVHQLWLWLVGMNG
jgi:hypothetical protein